MEKLKPCPFCGSEAVVNYKQALGTWVVECTNSCCPASYMIGMDYDTKLEAVDAWNRRKSDAAKIIRRDDNVLQSRNRQNGH